MLRIFRLTTLFVLGLMCAAVAEAADAPIVKRPNIIFVLADDMGWADLHCYGNPDNESPNLDRLAQSGVRFTDAYAAAPVCTPTRASLMTGKHPARLRMTIWREQAQNPPRYRKLIPPCTVEDLPHSETTIAELLKESGYLTALVGKWHLGGAAHYPETHGFDLNVGGSMWGMPKTFFYPFSGLIDKEYRYMPGLWESKPGDYLTDRLTDKAIEFIDQAGDRPFFLYLAYHSVHTPIEAKAEDVQYFTEKFKKSGSKRNPTYAAMIRSLDENVGRVMSHLRERKLDDNTIIVYFSDNGGFTRPFNGMQVTDNSPLRSGKGALYEGGIREPLIVRWPGVTPSGAVCHTPVISNDLYHTIASMAGSTPPEDATRDGLDISPLLKNPKASLDRDTLYFHYPHYYYGKITTPVSAVRDGDWKLLKYYEDNHLELYNLREDLGEQTDLASKMPEKAEQLNGLLQTWLKSVDAQLPTANPQRER